MLVYIKINGKITGGDRFIRKGGGGGIEDKINKK
jgi:hypothetical protein